MFNPFKIFHKKKIGLVLGSGGTKGFAHISVIENLEKLNIPVHFISGSSAGSIIGAIYAAGSLEEFKNEMLSLSWTEKINLFDPVLPYYGLLKGEKLMKLLGRFIPADMNIEDLPVELTVVATDFYSGKSIELKKGNILNAIRASISFPGILKPYRIDDSFLIDGGVANPLPINTVKNMGATGTIAVNLHPVLPPKKVKKQYRTGNKILTLNDKGVEKDGITKMIRDIPFQDNIKKFLKKVMKNSDKEKAKSPAILETITQAIDIMGYTQTNLMLKYNPPTILIEPELTDIATLDLSQIQRTMDEGNRAFERVKKRLMLKLF